RQDVPVGVDELDKPRVLDTVGEADVSDLADAQTLNAGLGAVRRDVDQRLVANKPGVEAEIDGVGGRIDRQGEGADGGRVTLPVGVEGAGGPDAAALFGGGLG